MISLLGLRANPALLELLHKVCLLAFSFYSIYSHLLSGSWSLLNLVQYTDEKYIKFAYNVFMLYLGEYIIYSSDPIGYDKIT